ncbi:chloramphenicol phosphotransferase [Deinococcus metallilatus]|uniref:Chloramphenicol 3-O phosphotransferase n=1 Tax=Deinococcus metallilatus TaxID=1211322 RepID=A0AAJ5F3Y8_9DEIO|nr:chloramphenicol phosphotransferase [Deinococcus metallilatus]MBB5294744.1 chloramphenicol 3-O phosphotransferase [Deinococcus metallilatus]QBY09527.1 chloramphenicol phosphotransferase [Deinococcus metallilatus]RXJ09532.1 chloramphenicol phosphotransferase [Deinococcus metallilatus]TLK29054.1 chloramphenicol phosphotransferase [Deinococcus metallilatus]GMA16670.1 putative O-phosphotransferase [Deinococcus metallilatus]
MSNGSAGKLILVNGASSAGKSTLCRAVRDKLDVPFLFFSLDFFLFTTDVLPKRRDPDGTFAWAAMRPHVFEGFYRCLPALLSAGNNPVVELIVETREQMDRLLDLLAPFDVFFVGLHCPLPELERRERARGDRRVGDARRDFETVHTFGRYDLEIDATKPLDQNVEAIITAWRARTRRGVFERMAAEQ